MAKQANRMMIGGFVVIALILLAASLVVFGSGRFFKKSNDFVLYFDGSIKGLHVGAPVLFQGVPVGSVKNISLRVAAENLRTQIPVVIDIEPDRFQLGEGDQETAGQTPKKRRENAQKLIDLGLRAVLTMQSFITGQLMIELDFYPGTPVQLKGTNGGLIEIPTIESTTQKVTQTLQQLDLDGMKSSLENTLAGVDRFVNDPDLKAGVGELKSVLTDTRRLMQNVNSRIGPLIDGADATLEDVRKLVKKFDKRVEPLADTLNRTVEDFGKLARDTGARLGLLTKSLDKTLSGARGALSEDAPVIIELENALTEISGAARSVRQLSDYLERHPEALIQGKGKPGGK
ncbi:MAG: MlaD family protein [Desulfobacterales bacterium]